MFLVNLRLFVSIQDSIGAKEMKCPKCQFENPVEARFCMDCDRQTSFSSTSFLQALSLDEKKDKIQRCLPKCLIDKILSQKDKIEGERKQVTVIFCDMEGFTPLVDSFGSEVAYSIMDQIYEIQPSLSEKLPFLSKRTLPVKYFKDLRFVSIFHPYGLFDHWIHIPLFIVYKGFAENDMNFCFN